MTTSSSLSSLICQGYSDGARLLAQGQNVSGCACLYANDDAMRQVCEQGYSQAPRSAITVNANCNGNGGNDNGTGGNGNGNGHNGGNGNGNGNGNVGNGNSMRQRARMASNGY